VTEGGGGNSRMGIERQCEDIYIYIYIYASGSLVQLEVDDMVEGSCSIISLTMARIMMFVACTNVGLSNKGGIPFQKKK